MSEKKQGNIAEQHPTDVILEYMALHLVCMIDRADTGLQTTMTNMFPLINPLINKHVSDVKINELIIKFADSHRDPGVRAVLISALNRLVIMWRRIEGFEEDEATTKILARLEATKQFIEEEL